MEVRKKRPRGFKKEAQGVQVSPLNPLSVAPWPVLPARLHGVHRRAPRQQQPQHLRSAVCRDDQRGRAGAWEKQVLSARGFKTGRKALRIRHINGMKVREKRPKGFK